MIHEIGKELGDRLSAIGLSIPIVEGPENPTTTWGRERIVIEHQFDGTADSFAPPRSQSINPKIRRLRTAAYKMTIYAQSSKSGAGLFEHCRRADKIIDEVLVEMDYVAAARKNRWAPSSGRFITPKLLVGAEVPGGAVYELLFTFERGVAARTWAGAIRPEFTLGAGGMLSRTDVSGPGADLETACGDD